MRFEDITAVKMSVSEERTASIFALKIEAVFSFET
jgi:hypothetical protein